MLEIQELRQMPASPLHINREGPLILTPSFPDTKDPCPVFDGKLWHIFGSGGNIVTEKWQIYHTTSLTVNGPWTEQQPAKIALDSPHVAAPGVIYDAQEKMFHMFVQTDFLGTNGTIEHLLSFDGERFNNFGTVLKSIPNSAEAGLYDAHPAMIKGEKYLVYSAMGNVKNDFDDTPFAIGQPNIFLAKSISNSWYGPWNRLGPILTHEEVPHHNQITSPNYEWGLEGPQLVELPNGKVLLIAVCFLPENSWGTRQRVFFSISDNVMGKFKTLGPILQTTNDEWQSGETGHAAGVVLDNKLHLFYQARKKGEFTEFNHWRYGKATFNLGELQSYAERFLN